MAKKLTAAEIRAKIEALTTELTALENNEAEIKKREALKFIEEAFDKIESLVQECRDRATDAGVYFDVNESFRERDILEDIDWNSSNCY
jgi:hypothetical protein